MMTATEIIQDAGLRPTANRVAVLEILLKTDNPLSHQELLEELSRQHEYDRVTLYRVLRWLLDNNFVHKVADEHRAWRYQHNTSNHHHAHFQCLHCAKIYCLDDISPRIPTLPEGFQAESMELYVKGCCASCLAHKHA